MGRSTVTVARNARFSSRYGRVTWSVCEFAGDASEIALQSGKLKQFAMKILADAAVRSGEGIREYIRLLDR